MTGKRVAAVFATIILIVGAVLLRSVLDESKSIAAGPSPTEQPADSAVLTIVCSTEFNDACQDLKASYGAKIEVISEPAGVTLDRLAKPKAQLPDMWFTLQPFAAMLAAPGASSVVVASAKPQLTLLADRAAALEGACGTTSLWRCLGNWAGDGWAEHGGQTAWGSIKPGIADPANEAIGLVQLANAVGGYFATTTFSRNDWEADLDFTSWFRNIHSRSKLTTAKTPLATLVTQASALSIAATDTAEVARTSQAATNKYLTLTPSPTFVVNAELTSFGTSNADLRADVRTSLATSLTSTYSWDKASTASLDDRAGTFIALRLKWKELK